MPFLQVILLLQSNGPHLKLAPAHFVGLPGASALQRGIPKAISKKNLKK